jgi:hypothetical protein
VAGEWVPIEFRNLKVKELLIGSVAAETDWQSVLHLGIEQDVSTYFR